MDPKDLSPAFPGRPIILSPPPLEQHKFANMGQPQAPAIAPQPQMHPRQQLVGYNLQHEFETLTNDLDLDLKNKDTSPPGRKFNSGHSILAGSHFGDLSLPVAKQAAPAAATATDLGSLLNAGPALLLFLPLAQLPDRPQLVNDFLSFFGRQQQQTPLDQQPQPQNFYLDLLLFTNWIENLSPQDNITMIEYLCNNLPIDILLSFKLKLEAHLTHHTQPYVARVASPFQGDFVAEMDGLSLHLLPQLGLHAPKPKQNAFRNHLFADPKAQRPKSAEPSLINRFQVPQTVNQHPNPQLERSRSPTLHLYEKTSFLQQAASNRAYNPPQQAHTGVSASEDHLNMNSHAALKLGALATINSRVALDSNRKNPPYYQQTPQGRHYGYEEPINRIANSLLVPATNQRYSVQLPPHKKRYDDDDDKQSQALGSLMPADIASPELLNDIPAWLKLLRLHKYTDCLRHIPWRELVELDDTQLEEHGVKALGARRKLLKAFDAVKAVN